MTDDELVRLLQTRLAQAGHYAGNIDGDAGPATVAALDKALPPAVTSPTQPMMGADKLAGVHNALAGVIREAVLRSPVPFAVIEGLRSRERQAQLVKAGASRTMNSRHITGHAVDLWPLDPATMKRLPSDAAFKRGSPEARAADKALWDGLRAIAATVQDVARAQGVTVTWGGSWAGFPDGPHFEIDPKTYS
mgnify:CR=1 FL=1